MRIGRFLASAWAVSLAFAPGVALSQDAARNLDELRLKVKAGDTIYVTDDSGRERSGRIVDLTAAVLTVSFAGTSRELTEKSIVKIRKRQPDPLWTGALIGAGIGLALGATAAAFSEECSHNAGSGACVGPALSMGAIGAGVGVGIDALIQGRKVIYQAPGLSFHLSPMIAPGRVGIRVSVGGARNRPRSQPPGRPVH